MALHFEWDPEKAHSNFEKHGVTFDEAGSAFRDALSMTIPDPLHSDDEDRFVLIGYSHRERLLVIVHTYRSYRVRLISARPATKRERRHYENNA